MKTTRWTVIALNIIGLIAWGMILQTVSDQQTKIVLLAIMFLHGCGIVQYVLAKEPKIPVKDPLFDFLSQ